jgi:hypothetical protein
MSRRWEWIVFGVSATVALLMWTVTSVQIANRKSYLAKLGIAVVGTFAAVTWGIAARRRRIRWTPPAPASRSS